MTARMAPVGGAAERVWRSHPGSGAAGTVDGADSRLAAAGMSRGPFLTGMGLGVTVAHWRLLRRAQMRPTGLQLQWIADTPGIPRCRRAHSMGTLDRRVGRRLPLFFRAARWSHCVRLDSRAETESSCCLLFAEGGSGGLRVLTPPEVGRETDHVGRTRPCSAGTWRAQAVETCAPHPRIRKMLQK